MGKSHAPKEICASSACIRDKRHTVYGDEIEDRATNSGSSSFCASNQTQRFTVEDLHSIIHIDNMKFTTFSASSSSERVFSCSWSEAKLLNQTQNTKREMLSTFTERHILRCYPAGSRVMSDNFDPSMAWSIGAQMAALNFQANDESIWINRGKYLANGACGFVRKPDYLLNVALHSLVKPVLLLKITVVACSGWEVFLEKHKTCVQPDTCICMSLSGSTLDSKSQMTSVFRSRARNGPCAQPFFNETFNFRIFEPDLSVLLFTVYDKSATSENQLLAQSSFPVSLLRTGIRPVSYTHLRAHETLLSRMPSSA